MRAFVGVVGLRTRQRVNRMDFRRTELAENAPVHLPGQRSERRCRADHRDPRILAAGQFDKAGEDHPLPYFVFGATNDDDVSLGHRAEYAMAHTDNRCLRVTGPCWSSR